MLKICTFFSIQNIFNNGFEIHSLQQCFSVVLGKRIVKTMHCYKKCLILALVLVLKIFLTWAFIYTLNKNVFRFFSAKELSKLCIVIKKCLTVALVLVFKLFLTRGFVYTLHNNVFRFF